MYSDGPPLRGYVYGALEHAFVQVSSFTRFQEFPSFPALYTTAFVVRALVICLCPIEHRASHILPSNIWADYTTGDCANRRRYIKACLTRLRTRTFEQCLAGRVSPSAPLQIRYTPQTFVSKHHQNRSTNIPTQAAFPSPENTSQATHTVALGSMN
jgi:hypothetical protein